MKTSKIGLVPFHCKSFLLSLLFLNVSLCLNAQDITLSIPSGEPYCPDVNFTFTASVSGLPSGNSVCSWQWTIPAEDGTVITGANTSSAIIYSNRIDLRKSNGLNH
jgi:hypothetical protein